MSRRSPDDLVDRITQNQISCRGQMRFVGRIKIDRPVERCAVTQARSARVLQILLSGFCDEQRTWINGIIE